jgi:hypothetical protein
MNGVEQLLNKLAEDRFFGSLEIKFESGKPVLLRKTETIKSLATSENYRDNRGASHDNRQP